VVVDGALEELADLGEDVSVLGRVEPTELGDATEEFGETADDIVLQRLLLLLLLRRGREGGTKSQRAMRRGAKDRRGRQTWGLDGPFIAK
jgi:hypothetical protein